MNDNDDDDNAFEEADDLTYLNNTCSREYKEFRSKRLSFSRHDDQQILEWIIKNQAFHLVQGNVIWKRMEEQNLGIDRTWKSLKDRFETHICGHLHQYKLSRSNIWKIEKGLGILEDNDMVCDTDMEDEASEVSDTGVKQKMIRKRVTNQPVLSTDSDEGEDIGGRSRTRRCRRKQSRYKDSNFPQSSNLMNNSSNAMEVSALESGVEDRLSDNHCDKKVKDSSSNDGSTDPEASVKNITSGEVIDDRLREDSEPMKEVEVNLRIQFRGL